MENASLIIKGKLPRTEINILNETFEFGSLVDKCDMIQLWNSAIFCLFAVVGLLMLLLLHDVIVFRH